MLITAPRNSVPLVLALALVAGACRSQPGARSSGAQVSQDVWAVIDGREIRREDIEKAYRRTVPPSHAIPDEEATTTKLKLLDQWIAQDILVAKGNELKIVVPDSELDAAFKGGTGNIPDADFNKELAARNLTAADMRDALRRDLLTQKLLEREVNAKVVVTDQDINDFFQTNKEQFNLTEDAFRLAQIVVTPTRDAGVNNRTGDDAATPQAAAAKIQMLTERLKAGTPFQELAMDFSEEPQSTQQGGDIGLVPVSALSQAPPQLRDAVMKLQPGGVSVVNTGDGYTVVALIGKQTAGQRDPSMPEVRDGIAATLRERREQLLRAAYLEELRNRAVVVNHLARQLVESQGKLPATLSSAAPK